MIPRAPSGTSPGAGPPRTDAFCSRPAGFSATGSLIANSRAAPSLVLAPGFRRKPRPPASRTSGKSGSARCGDRRFLSQRRRRGGIASWEAPSRRAAAGGGSIWHLQAGFPPAFAHSPMIASKESLAAPKAREGLRRNGSLKLRRRWAGCPRLRGRASSPRSGDPRCGSGSRGTFRPRPGPSSRS